MTEEGRRESRGNVQQSTLSRTRSLGIITVDALVAHYATLKHMQAVGTHYGPTQIIWPTGHAIRGTAQAALTLELI